MRSCSIWIVSALVFTVGAVLAQDGEPSPDDCCVILEFEDAVPGECLNEKYADLGIHFRRGTSECIRALDLREPGWWSPSMPMAATNSRGADEVPSPTAFRIDFDRLASRVSACVGNDGPGMSLRTMCYQSPTSWGGGHGPLNGNYDLDEDSSTGPCRTVTFEDRFGNYAITIDRLRVQYCGARRCTVLGDGEPYTIELDHPDIPDLCSPEFPGPR